MVLQKAAGFLLVFLPFILFYFIIYPIVGFPIWVVARLVLAALRWPSEQLPDWMETPWDFMCTFAIRLLCVKVVDADGNHSFVLPEIPRGQRCAVLTNHRSWGDFFIDPVMAHGSIVARIAAVAVTMLAGAIGLASDKIVMINRGVDSRQTINDKCERHVRFVIYPEGTRRAAHPDADEPVPLKPGGLKNIYEAKRPAVIHISVNKEALVNERNFTIGLGVTLYRARSALIDPTDYETFEAFLHAIQSAWDERWRRAYALRAECEGRGPRLLDDQDAGYTPPSSSVSSPSNLSSRPASGNKKGSTAAGTKQDGGATLW